MSPTETQVNHAIDALREEVRRARQVAEVLGEGDAADFFRFRAEACGVVADALAARLSRHAVPTAP